MDIKNECLHPSAVFMHDLPACVGEEIEGGILDHQISLCYQQAEFKMYTARAIYHWLLG